MNLSEPWSAKELDRLPREEHPLGCIIGAGTMPIVSLVLTSPPTRSFSPLRFGSTAASALLPLLIDDVLLWPLFRV